MKKKKSYNLHLETLDIIDNFYDGASRTNDTEKLEGIIHLFDDLYNEELKTMNDLIKYNEFVFFMNCFKNTEPIYTQIKDCQYFTDIIKSNLDLAKHFNIDVDTLIGNVENINTFSRVILYKEIYKAINSVLFIPENYSLIDKSTIKTLVKLTSWNDIGEKIEHIYDFRSAIVMTRGMETEGIINSSLLKGFYAPDEINVFTDRGIAKDLVEELVESNYKGTYEYKSDDKYFLVVENNIDENSLNKILVDFYGSISTYEGVKPRYEVEFIYGSSLVLTLKDTIIHTRYYYCKNANSFEEALDEIYNVPNLWIDSTVLNNLPSADLERIKTTKYNYKDKISMWESITKCNIV